MSDSNDDSGNGCAVVLIVFLLLMAFVAWMDHEETMEKIRQHAATQPERTEP